MAEEWKEHIARIDQSLSTLNREQGEMNQEIVKLREAINEVQLGFATFKAEMTIKLEGYEDIIKHNRKLLWTGILQGFLTWVGLIGLVIALMKFVG